jgi:O-antigen ligase
VLFFAAVVARPEYGIALFLSTFLMTYPAGLQGTGSLTINNVLGGIFLILLTYKVRSEEDWWFIRVPEVQLLAFIIVMFYIANQVNGPDPHLPALVGVQRIGSENLRTVTTRAAFTLFFINFIRAPRHVRMIYLLALAFMVVTALTGIRSVLHGAALHGYRAMAARGGVTIGAASNPNRLAMFAILAIAGLWFLRRSMGVAVLRLLIIPILVLLALAVVMTASRSGLLGLGVCVAYIVWDQVVNLRQLFIFAIAGVMALSLAARVVPEKSLERITNLPFTQAGETGEGAGSLARRGYTWEIGLQMVEEHPFLGVGAGNWELTRFLKDPTHSMGAVHNSYLLALAEGGVFVLAAYTALLWRTWRNLRIAERYLADPKFPLADMMWIVKGAKVSLLVFVFFSVFADLWQFVILFWLVGLGVVLRRLVEKAALEETLAY